MKHLPTSILTNPVYLTITVKLISPALPGEHHNSGLQMECPTTALVTRNRNADHMASPILSEVRGRGLRRRHNLYYVLYYS